MKHYGTIPMSRKFFMALSKEDNIMKKIDFILPFDGKEYVLQIKAKTYTPILSVDIYVPEHFKFGPTTIMLLYIYEHLIKSFL